MTPLWLAAVEKLAEWWWSLTDEEREQGRAQFLQQMNDDPEFAERVMKLLREEQPYDWAPDPQWFVPDEEGP